MTQPLIKNKQFTLAENLLWDHRCEAYFFIDIEAHQLFKFTPNTEFLRSWRLPEKVGCMCLCDDGNVLVGLTSGIYHFDLHSEALTFIGHPLKDHCTDIRYNDGRVDQDGNFWFASMDQSANRRPIAYLFCLLTSGKILTVQSSIRVGNGIAFHDTNGCDHVYFSDTRAPKIYAYNRLEAIQNAINKKPTEFATFAIADDTIGRPDGGTVDSEGNYWSAGVSAGNLNKFSSEGELLATYPLPMQNPTIPCFGGKELNQLAIASLRKDSINNPLGGTIVAKKQEITGKLEHLFPWKAYVSSLT